MDQNVFPAVPQRGPRGPVPISIPLAPLRTAPVSLNEPRPQAERRDNEYVDAPLRSPAPPLLPSTAASTTSALPAHRPPAPPPPQAPVAKQPLSYSKAMAPECSATSANPAVMCSDCGRCRCHECVTPKSLPDYWACNGACLVSGDSLVDYTSCLCCVKGLFYHCADADDVDNNCANHPCGCGPDKRTARWGCLAALACVLPCLWLYWPLRGAKRAVELCYARHSRRGCRCRPKPPPQPTDKRLLANDSL